LGYSGVTLSTVTLRLLFCLALLALLPLRTLACAGVAGPAATVAAQQASADSRPAADRATLNSRTAAAMPEDHLTASCDNCQSCPQCHTPAVTSGMLLAMGQVLPPPPLVAARSAFSSTSHTPRLKPPIS
jgi:hypothetical protein